MSDGKISTDLCVKSIFRYQFPHYTLPHPDHTKRSVVFSQTLRVSGISSDKSDIFKHPEKNEVMVFESEDVLRISLKRRWKKISLLWKYRNTKRDKLLKVVPFVVTYHLMSNVILKYLDLYIEKKVKRVLTPQPIIQFWSVRKLGSYLVRAKVYPTKKTKGFFKLCKMFRGLCKC